MHLIYITIITLHRRLLDYQSLAWVPLCRSFVVSITQIGFRIKLLLCRIGLIHALVCRCISWNTGHATPFHHSNFLFLFRNDQVTTHHWWNGLFRLTLFGMRYFWTLKVFRKKYEGGLSEPPLIPNRVNWVNNL